MRLPIRVPGPSRTERFSHFLVHVERPHRGLPNKYSRNCCWESAARVLAHVRFESGSDAALGIVIA